MSGFCISVRLKGLVIVESADLPTDGISGGRGCLDWFRLRHKNAGPSVPSSSIQVLAYLTRWMKKQQPRIDLAYSGGLPGTTMAFLSPARGEWNRIGRG